MTRYALLQECEVHLSFVGQHLRASACDHFKGFCFFLKAERGLQFFCSGAFKNSNLYCPPTVAVQFRGPKIWYDEWERKAADCTVEATKRKWVVAAYLEKLLSSIGMIKQKMGFFTLEAKHPKR